MEIENALYNESKREEEYKARIRAAMNKLKSPEFVKTLMGEFHNHASSQSITELVRTLDVDLFPSSPKTPRLEPHRTSGTDTPAATSESWTKKLLEVVQKLIDVYGNQRIVSNVTFR